jgi:hypothetical protein
VKAIINRVTNMNNQAESNGLARQIEIISEEVFKHLSDSQHREQDSQARLEEKDRQLRKLVDHIGMQDSQLQKKDQQLSQLKEIVLSLKSQLDEIQQERGESKHRETCKFGQHCAHHIAHNCSNSHVSETPVSNEQETEGLESKESQSPSAVSKPAEPHAQEEAKEAPDTVTPVAQLSLRTLQATTPRNLFGKCLYPRVQLCLIERFSFDVKCLTPKITGMLLEFPVTELLHLLEEKSALAAKVDKAVHVLLKHLGEQVLLKQLGERLSQPKPFSREGRAADVVEEQSAAYEGSVPLPQQQ